MREYLPLLIVGAVLLIVWFILASRVSGGAGGNSMSNFGKARTVLGVPDGKKVTFEDVAGADEEKQELEERHYLLWTEAREKHLQTNRDTAEGRRKSLAISHSKTLERLNDKLNVVTDERIRKMHMGKIAKAESLFEGNVKKIDAALQNVDIEYSIIAYGVMNIRREM